VIAATTLAAINANPVFDWHALAPDLVIVATIVIVLLADILLPERSVWQTSRIAAIGVLAALIPVVTLAADGQDRVMFGGTYVVDNYALALKGFFLVVTYVVILMSIDYVREGDYYEGEFYFLLLVSVFGMSIMASGRDLITLFVALETISIPTFVLATYRKHDRRSNEAGVKYYLIGVLSSALMLYGMSLIFGITNSTKLFDIAQHVSRAGAEPLLAVAIFLALVGFAFKVSAVPFHFWAPDTYEGAPTPVTAFLSVASKAGGFVALINIVYFGFYGRSRIGVLDGLGAHLWWPAIWALAALSMTFGNLSALRQTNIVRLLAYSAIAQGGFMLVPFAAAGIAGASGKPTLEANATAANAMGAVVIYLLIYGAMNLGAFAVVIAVARRTHSAEIETYAGLGLTSPGLAVTMTIFMFSLAGIPPFAGWFAKFVMFRSVLDAHTAPAVVLGVIAAVASVIAFFYYARVVRKMWFDQPAEGAVKVQVPAALMVAIGITAALVLVIGIYPQFFAHIGDLAFRVS
jgi:NADH-quinone oxidoreductase subunit N